MATFPLIILVLVSENGYHKVTIIYGYKFQRILKIVDLASINFSDFAIICSINLKIYNQF